MKESYVSEATLDEAQSNAQKCVPHIALVRSEKPIQKEMSLEEVARQLGVSRDTARLIEKNALAKLRTSMKPEAVALREFY